MLKRHLAGTGMVSGLLESLIEVTPRVTFELQDGADAAGAPSKCRSGARPTATPDRTDDEQDDAGGNQ